MGKRMVETTRWMDAWFGNLRPEFKLLYIYLCDHCDNAGVWNVNKPLADKFIGLSITWDQAIPEMEGRIIELAGGKRWFLAKFLEFQYAPRFNANIPAHNQAKRLLVQHGLDLLAIPWIPHGGGIGMGLQSLNTGQDRTHSISSSGESAERGWTQREQVEAECQGLVLCANAKAVQEWMDALREHGKCRSVEEAVACMRWAVNAARNEGKEITFLRHAINYVRRWPANRPEQFKRKKTA